MINLTINAYDCNLYELTSRHSQPQSSAAQIYRNDLYLIMRLIARLPVEPNTWIQLLAQLGQRPADLYSSSTGGIYQAVANAVMRGDLNLYKLPLLDSATSLRGKNDIGLCLIKGPKPHCATHLNPEPIASPEAAQALFSELGIETRALLAYLNGQNLYNSYDQQNPLNEVLKRLAKSELLAYKIPLPPMSVPEKEVQYLPATGPGYDPVPLAPERSSSSSASKSVPVVEPAPKPQSAQNLDECENRLAAARERLDQGGYQAKYTDDQQLAKVQSNEVSKERFLVSFQTKNTNPDAKLAFQRDSGLAPIWATSFDQLENADTDPKLIADVLGTDYESSKEYVLHIVDRGENLDQFGQNTFVPTWDNMQNPVQKCLGEKHDPKILSEVMTPEYQKQYASDIDTFHSAGLNEFNIKDQQKYASKLSEEDGKKFNARHNVRTEIGANSEFTGNGLTQSREGSTQYGVVEVLTLENNPPQISKMANVKTITLKPRGVA